MVGASEGNIKLLGDDSAQFEAGLTGAHEQVNRFSGAQPEDEAVVQCILEAGVEKELLRRLAKLDDNLRRAA